MLFISIIVRIIKHVLKNTAIHLEDTNNSVKYEDQNNIFFFFYLVLLYTCEKVSHCT